MLADQEWVKAEELADLQEVLLLSLPLPAAYGPDLWLKLAVSLNVTFSA